MSGKAESSQNAAGASSAPARIDPVTRRRWCKAWAQLSECVDNKEEMMKLCAHECRTVHLAGILHAADHRLVLERHHHIDTLARLEALRVLREQHPVLPRPHR